MQGWLIFWSIVIIISWVLFLGVSLLVALKGWGELKTFHREIKEKHENHKD